MVRHSLSYLSCACSLHLPLDTGVHRGAEVTMDVSADLTELSLTPVTVVSSGVKSILDIPKTLEVLETLGVPVCGYKTTEFPGFFTNITGCRSPLVVDSSKEVASMMIASEALGLKNGMLVAVPNPDPATGMGIDDVKLARMIEDSVVEANKIGINGAAITPYLLSKVAHLSGGTSVDSNVALVCNNAKIATLIAADFARLKSKEPRKKAKDSTVRIVSGFEGETKWQKKENLKNRIVVVGGMVIDHVVSPILRNKTDFNPLILRTSNPGSAVQSFGGVGRNIAEAASEALVSSKELKTAVQMISAVGNDAYGLSLLRHTSSLGIDVNTVVGGHEWTAPVSDRVNSASAQRTATYTAVHDHTGDLLVAVADMGIFSEGLTPEIVRTGLSDAISNRNESKLVVIDGNLSSESFGSAAAVCVESNIPLIFEPTSIPKASVPLEADCMNKVYCICVYIQKCITDIISLRLTL